ncbi:MAG TPA: hypothetical protein VGD05_02495 [Pyrinomonadaceae bacterium]|jgi:hypothetical protein
MNKEKSYTIEFEDREEYLYVLVSGEQLSSEIAKQYWEEIAKERVKLKRSKVMVEKNFTQSVSMAEMYDMGVKLSDNFKRKKIAFLDRYGNGEVNDFGQMVAQNQGVKIKVFTNIAEAERWLTENN